MPLAIGAAIGAVLFALGAPLAIVNFAVFTLGTLIVNAAISVGLSLLAGALLQRGQTNTPSPSDLQQELKQALSPRLRSYGTVRVAGPLWWFAVSSRTLFKGAALNHGRIGGYVSLSIDDNDIDRDVNDKVTSAPYSAGNVWVHTRLGLPTETKYTDLLTTFNVDNARGDGVATLLGMLENPTSAAAYQNMFPSGQPLLRAVFDASVVADPRDSTQDRDVETTLMFSDNPVVCLVDYLTSLDGYGIPWEDVERNLPAIMDAMDVCDELVPLASGLEGKRYRVAGTYRFTDAPRDVVAKFESCCDGRVWIKRDGSIGIAVGKFPTDLNALPHITDSHVTGYTDFVRGQDPLRSIQGIRGEFMSPEHGYREHEAEPWPTGVDVLALTDERTVSMDLLWVPSATQARRLMKRAYTRALAPWRGTVHTDAAGMRAIDERYVRLTITELGIDDETFEVVGFRFNPEAALACELDLIAVDASIDDWDPSEEGTAEATSMSFVSEFSKTGTAVDVLTEAGGELGQYALVFCCNSAGISATPAGWRLINSAAGPSSGLAHATFGKKLDGTEVSTTFLAGSGAIIVVLLSGVNAALFPDVRNRLEANIYSENITPTATPFGIFAFGNANADFVDANFLRLIVTPGNAPIFQHSFNHSTGASMTGYVKFAVLLPGEVLPGTNINAGVIVDYGTLGLTAFLMTPG